MIKSALVALVLTMCSAGGGTSGTFVEKVESRLASITCTGTVCTKVCKAGPGQWVRHVVTVPCAKFPPGSCVLLTVSASGNKSYDRC